jgi:hypothetical protein
VLGDDVVDGQDGLGVTGRAEHPGAQLELVGAQVQDRVVELAAQRQRPPLRARLVDALGGRGLLGARGVDHEGGDPLVPVQLDRQVGVADGVAVDGAVERRQRDPPGVGGTVRGRRALARDPGAVLEQLGRRGELVDEPPLDGPLAPHALLQRREDVRAVATHAPLVGHTRQAAGPGQDRQQRHLGQGHGGGVVVGQDQVVARQRQLVAATGARAVDGRDPGLARVRGGVLDAVAGLVGELAEVHLPRVR